MFDFDRIIDRSGSYSVKYDYLNNPLGAQDMLSMWVADMDFATPECVRRAIEDYAATEVYGYAREPEQFAAAVVRWQKQEHDWAIEQNWVSFVPGIVRAIAYAIGCFTEKGDKIIVQSPVYHPFTNVPTNNGRVVLRNPLIEDKDGWRMDLDGLEKLIEDGGADGHPVKMLILCNPHNPGGLIWSHEELANLAEICLRHKVIVISDEIHSDLMLWHNKHIPFATVSEAAARISITFGAPSKTFNMPGLAASWAIVPCDKLREKFYNYLEANEFSSPGLIASRCCIAALEEGRAWRDAVVSYIEDNILTMKNFFEKHDLGIKAIVPQASYLVWLDCRSLLARLTCKAEGEAFTDADQAILNDWWLKEIRVHLNDGSMFGVEGRGFMRLNAGCPRSIINDLLSRL